MILVFAFHITVSQIIFCEVTRCPWVLDRLFLQALDVASESLVLCSVVSMVLLHLKVSFDGRMRSVNKETASRFLHTACMDPAQMSDQQQLLFDTPASALACDVLHSLIELVNHQTALQQCLEAIKAPSKQDDTALPIDQPSHKALLQALAPLEGNLGKVYKVWVNGCTQTPVSSLPHAFAHAGSC